MRRALIIMLFVICAIVGAKQALAEDSTFLTSEVPWYSGKVYTQMLAPTLVGPEYDNALAGYPLPGDSDDAYPIVSPTPTRSDPMIPILFKNYAWDSTAFPGATAVAPTATSTPSPSPSPTPTLTPTCTPTLTPTQAVYPQPTPGA